jgi:uncharacterized protein YegP (UPF0339 family)
MKTISSLRTLALAVVLAAAPACAVEDADTEIDALGELEAAADTRPSFDLWTNAAGRTYFHMEAGNGEIILASQGYDARVGAVGGILSVLDHGGLASNYSIKLGADGKHYVSLKAANGEIIATGQGYSTRSNATRGINTLVANVGSFLAYWDAMAGARIQVNAGAAGKYSFNLHAANGAVVLSSESYTTEAAALNGGLSVLDNAATLASYELRVSASGKHYFVLKAGNNEIIGTSQLYATKSSAIRGRDAMIALVASGAVQLF